jgi:hypothetical protein
MTKAFIISRFVVLWVLCPLVALATARVIFGGVAETMSDFLYHAELRAPAFYSHIILASLALGLLPLQFSQRIRQRYVTVHRWLGRIYGAAILVSGTGGFWLALTTQSGPIAAWGFAVLAIAWIGATATGVFHAVQHKIRSHQAWMIRSAALTMAAVTLRIYLGIGAVYGHSYGDMAGSLAWSCWVPNLIVAELLIRKQLAFRHSIRLRATELRPPR